MALNVVWLALFFLAGIFALVRMATGADPQVFPAMIQASFDSAKTGFEIALGLTGVLSLWMGLMKVGEKGGAVGVISRLLAPLLRRIFPGLPADHPAAGAMVLNFAANMLGLDNAATPAGLKAMKELQTLNPDPETATDHQVMFMVLHAASLTLIPVSILAFRAQMKAANPADVFLPILIASFFSVMGGFLSVAFVQKIKLRDPVLLGILGGAFAAVGVLVWGLLQLPREVMEQVSSQAGAVILFGVIVWFLGQAAWKKVNVWEAFVEGAKEGFSTAVSIVPFLVGILVAVAMFRASGGMDYLVGGLWRLISWTGLPEDTVKALPTMLMKPLSGGGARGMMVDAMKTYGPDSFAARLSCLFQGSTDTTLYVLALYSGAVGLRKTRHALPCALVADLFGWVGALVMALLFFA